MSEPTRVDKAQQFAEYLEGMIDEFVGEYAESPGSGGLEDARLVDGHTARLIVSLFDGTRLSVQVEEIMVDS